MYHSYLASDNIKALEIEPVAPSAQCPCLQGQIWAFIEENKRL